MKKAEGNARSKLTHKQKKCGHHLPPSLPLIVAHLEVLQLTNTARRCDRKRKATPRPEEAGGTDRICPSHATSMVN